MKRNLEPGGGLLPAVVTAVDRTMRQAAAAAELRAQSELAELKDLLAQTRRRVTSTPERLARAARLADGGHRHCDDQRRDLLLKIIRVEAALAVALPTREQVDHDPRAALAALDEAISGMLDAEEALHRCQQGAGPDTRPGAPGADPGAV